MKSIRDDLEDLSDRIQDERMVADPGAIEEASELRDAVATEFAELTRRGSFRRHLVEYIQDEKAAFEAGERTEDGERKSLCTCSNPYCALKQGKLPPGVSLHDDLDEGITEYTASHSGRPVVLQEGRRDYIETFANVRENLEEALTVLRRSDPDDGDEE